MKQIVCTLIVAMFGAFAFQAQASDSSTAASTPPLNTGNGAVGLSSADANRALQVVQANAMYKRDVTAVPVSQWWGTQTPDPRIRDWRTEAGGAKYIDVRYNYGMHLGGGVAMCYGTLRAVLFANGKYSVRDLHGVEEVDQNGNDVDFDICYE